MPLYTQERTIREYWEKVHEKYPNVNFNQFEEVCKAPMNFIIQCMRAKDLPTILVKFLGKFQAFKPRVLQELNMQKRYLSSGTITQEQFDDQAAHFQTYLDNYDTKDELNELEELIDDVD